MSKVPMLRPQDVIKSKVELVDSSFIGDHPNSDEVFNHTISDNGVHALSKGNSWLADAGAKTVSKRKRIHELMNKSSN